MLHTTCSSTRQQSGAIMHKTAPYTCQWHTAPPAQSSLTSATLPAAPACSQHKTSALPQSRQCVQEPLQAVCQHSCYPRKQKAAHSRHGSRHVVAHAAAHTAFAATGTAASSTAASSTASSGATAMFAVLLGYCVLIGSCFRSLPQIVKVLKSGTTEGLSLTSNAVELLCYTIILAYNMQHGYDFSTYGEIIACWLQDVIIVGLIFRYTRMSTGLILASSLVFLTTCAALFYPGLCPPAVLSMLQLSTLFVMALGSRVPQIWLNVKRGNAGVMSLTTCLLNVAGNLVRTFTTLVLTQDILLLGGCVTQGLLNGVLLWQVLQTRRMQGRFGQSEPPADDSPGLQPQLA